MQSTQAHLAEGANPRKGLIYRTSVLLYGFLVYALFFAVFLYLIGFVDNLLVPKSIDTGPRAPWLLALLIDLLLVGVFGIQHTIMARSRFKIWLTTFIPQPAERSTFVLLTSLALVLLYVFWQPIDGVLWDASGSALGKALLGVSLLGWLLVLWSTFLINHFDLFGLRQVVLCFRGRKYTPVDFREPILYRYVRHPLYLGLIIAFWVTPTMTVGHLVFAAAMTAYILIGIRFEERDLARHHGEAYQCYQRQVSMLIPGPPRK